MAAAFSLVELLFVLGVAATLTAVAAPGFSAAVDDVRVAGAARYVTARLQQTRLRAITRSRDTALAIARRPDGFQVAVYEDGNRNGILTADIEAGTDALVGPAERLADQFPGVDFGAWPGIPGADSSTAPGSDPIRLGTTDRVTFTPAGTATPGSLYLHGRGGSQYVVRIFGETGRTRILKYNARTRTWRAL